MVKRKPKQISREEYEKFREYLKKSDVNRIKLSISEIENIIGCEKLCDSAYNHRVWWSGESHPISKIWLEEGYKLEELTLGSHIILVKNQIKLLENIGFEKVGNWLKLEDTNNSIDYDILSNFLEVDNLLYSFVIDNEIKYIGKTTKSLKQRMNQYQNPSSSQSTNIKNNKNILDALEKNKIVEIYIFKEKEHLIYNNIQLNLSAGLEDPLIDKFQPKWNKIGKNKEK